MADSFNPYRDWLGLANGQRPATHYGLFGLRPLESDADVIRKAISRLVAKVRGIHPGNRTREWQEIIKEILVARACLTDPAAKAAYDAQLRASGGATGAAFREAPMARPPASPQAKGVAPSAAKGKPGTPTKQKRTIKGSKAPSPIKDAPPLATPPAASSGASAPLPIWECPPDDGSQTPEYGHPEGYQADPPPIWEWSPDAGSPPSAYGYPQGYQGDPPPVLGPAQGYPGFAPADPAQAGHAPPGAAGYPPDEMSFAPDPEANQIAVPVEVFWDPMSEEMPEQSFTIVGLAITFLFSVVVVLATLIGFLMYQRYTMNVSTARARQPNRVEVAKPQGELPRPTVSDPGRSASEELARKKAGLQKNLTELVAALARRDIPAAQAIVAQARANAQSPDDQKTVDKYEKLSEDVREFLRIIGGRVSKFQPSEEVTLGKTRIIVVEARGGRFSFRYGSKILNYTVETLPTWLVTALADGNLADAGPSKELYGAFLAVDPEGDRSRARSLWSEAAKMGIKIDQLLPSLDSLPTAQGQ